MKAQTTSFRRTGIKQLMFALILLATLAVGNIATATKAHAWAYTCRYVYRVNQTTAVYYPSGQFYKWKYAGEYVMGFSPSGSYWQNICLGGSGLCSNSWGFMARHTVNLQYGATGSCG